MINPISSERFIEIVKTINDTKPEPGNYTFINPIKDYIIEGSVILTSPDYPSRMVILENCLFKDEVSCEWINLDESLNITRCKFEKTLAFRNCTSTSNLPLDNLSTANLIIENCIIETLILNENNFTNDVLLYKSTFSSFIIKHLNCERILFLQDVTIEKNCELDIVTIYEIRFYKCKFNSSVILKNIISPKCDFYESEFKNAIRLSGGKFKEYLRFQNSIVDNLLFIENIDSEGAIRIINGNEFKKGILINYYNEETKAWGGFKKIDLEASSFLGGLEIWGSKDNSASCEINEVIISRYLKGRISFTNLIIKETNIRGSNADAPILFNHIKFFKLKFNYFNNAGELQFLNMESTGEKNTAIEILYSNLGKAQFLNASLDSFSTIRIEHSILSEIMTSNVKWFSPEKLNESSKKKNEDYLKNIRELFGQLKYAIEKQGNTIQALDFKRHEMTAHKNELDLKWKKNIKDWFIMFVNQSNDYGRDWTLPVVLAATITFMFYCLLIILVEPVSTDFVFCDYGYVFFNLLNPLHTLDKLFPKTNISYSFLVNALDFIYKIVISYLIFQTVSAFRKHIK